MKNLKIMGTVVEKIVCDIAAFAVVNKLLHSCSGRDIVVNEFGCAPIQRWRAWKNTDLLSVIDANVLTSNELIQIVLSSMIKKLCRIVNIITGMVKALTPAPGLSTLARSGITWFVV